MTSRKPKPGLSEGPDSRWRSMTDHLESGPSESPGFARGYSLIECVVVISLLTVVMVFVGRMLHGLFQAEQASARDLVLDRRLADLAVQFREDVHTAETLTVGDRGSRLQCAGPAPRQVVYTISSRGVERSENATATQRDTFQLPGCHPEFRTAGEGTDQAVELTVSRPLPQLSYTPSASVTPGVVIVRAAPRKFDSTKE